MNGNVFQCHGKRKDSRQFKRTMDALQEYSKKNVRNPADLSPLFGSTIKEPTLEMPKDPIADDELDEKGNKTGKKLPLSATATLLWQEEVKDYFKRKREVKTSLATIYAVAWGQCSEAMKAKIK